MRIYKRELRHARIPYIRLGGEQVQFRNIVIIDGKEVDLKTLPSSERKRLADFWNRKAAQSLGYKEKDKTA